MHFTLSRNRTENDGRRPDDQKFIYLRFIQSRVRRPLDIRIVVVYKQTVATNIHLAFPFRLATQNIENEYKFVSET